MYNPLNGENKNQKRPLLGTFLLAERAGFEPANLFGLHAFQACALSQTTRPLQIKRGIFYHRTLSMKSLPDAPLLLSIFGHLPRREHSPAAGTQVKDVKDKVLVLDALGACFEAQVTVIRCQAGECIDLH